MGRELRREIARRDVSCGTAHIITRAGECEVRRVDANAVVDSVCPGDIGIVVRCTPQLDIREVDRKIYAANIQRTAREVVLGMLQVIVHRSCCRIRPDDGIRPIVLLRRRIDLNVEVTRPDGRFVDRPLAICRIGDLIVARIGLSRK